MPIYKCSNCGRVIEAPEGQYYCKVCGPLYVMHEVSRSSTAVVEVEEWLRARKMTPLAVGKDFKPYEGCTLIESRPYRTDEATLGKIMEAIKHGENNYSKKALIWDEREFMYKIVEVF